MLKLLFNKAWETPSLLLQELSSQIDEQDITQHDDMKLLIKWGLSTGTEIQNEKTIIFNNNNSIKLASDKFKSLQHLSIIDDEYLHVPNVYLTKEKIENWPVVGRTFKHTKGYSFWLLNNEQQINRMTRLTNRGKSKKDCAEYFVDFLNIEHEYRVHVFYDGISQRRYRIIRLQEKIRKEQHPGKLSDVIRSRRFGWHMSTIPLSSEGFNLIKRCARRAIKYLGLTFGAVDIGVVSDGTPYVLEVNTAPGLDTGGINRYANIILKQYANLPSWKEPINDND